MGKISDLWVRLGLKKDGYDKGMDDAGKKADSFGGKLKQMKAGAIAVWAAIGASVLAFAKEMIGATNRVGDAWDMFIAKSQAGWRTFMQTLSTMSLDGVVGKIREARNAAEELRSALDAEYEITNSIRLQKAAMAEELSQLELLARNVTRPYEERAKAAEDYLKKVKPIYDQELDLANRLLDAQQGRWLAGTGLQDTAKTREDLSRFLVDYGSNQGLANALASVLKLEDARKVTEQTMRKSGNFQALAPTLERQKAEIASLREYINSFAASAGYETDLVELARVYERLRGDSDTTPLVDALVRAGEAAGAYLRETRKMHSALNVATAQLEEATQQTETALEASPAERADLSLPAVTSLTGKAELVEMPDLLTHEWLERQKSVGLEAVEWQAGWIDLMAEGAQMLEDAMITSLGNALQAVTDMMFGLRDADAKAVLAAFIAPFGDMMKNMGSMIMSYGISMEAFKKAFSNPYAAIAAGAGLMAIGALISSGASRIASGSMGGGGGSTASYAGTSSSSPELQNYESTLTVYVEGRVSGSDIILAGQNQQNKWNR